MSKTPLFIQSLFPDMLWKGKKGRVEKSVYLTFDDGPTPEVTPWVLDILKEHQVNATFFCLGKNVKAFPEIFKRIKKEGHTVGNHSYNHRSGFSTSTSQYIQEVNDTRKLVDSDLFRPPYGRLRRTQRRKLIQDYTIVMWDVLSGDFNASITDEKCISNVVNNIEDGSIVVFHDSVKAFPVLQSNLSHIIDAVHQRGYRPLPLNYQPLSNNQP